VDLVFVRFRSLPWELLEPLVGFQQHWRGAGFVVQRKPLYRAMQKINSSVITELKKLPIPLCRPKEQKAMSEIKLNKDQQELIERVGVAYENHQMAPAPARVAALLLVVPQAELPFEDISRLLNLSKSATSNAINLLLTINRLEYITKPGERRRYFRVKLMTWREDLNRSLTGITAMSAIYKEVLAQRPKGSAEFNRSLADLAGFLEFMAKELPALYKKWEQRA